MANLAYGVNPMLYGRMRNPGQKEAQRSFRREIPLPFAAAPHLLFVDYYEH